MRHFKTTHTQDCKIHWQCNIRQVPLQSTVSKLARSSNQRNGEMKLSELMYDICWACRSPLPSSRKRPVSSICFQSLDVFYRFVSIQIRELELTWICTMWLASACLIFPLLHCSQVLKACVPDLCRPVTAWWRAAMGTDAFNFIASIWHLDIWIQFYMRVPRKSIHNGW